MASEVARSFVKWMEDNHFKLHPSTVFHKYNDERGYALLSAKDIPGETDLFEIPRQLVLGPATSQLFRLVGDEAFKELDTWNKLIITLMWEWTQPESPWRPYLDILPLSLSTPLFWGQDELVWLKGTDVESQIGYQKILSDFQENISKIIVSYPKIFNPELHNFDLYKRFGSIVMAYSFTNPDGEVVMMPMADMLNHKTGYNNARLFIGESDDVYEMKSISNISKDCEIFNTYGNLGNSELLRKYGFVDTLDNLFNVVDITLKLILETCKHKNLPNFETKLEFLKKHDLVHDDESFTLSAEEDNEEETWVDSRMIFILKLLVSSKKEWKNWREQIEASRKKNEGKTSVKNDTHNNKKKDKLNKRDESSDEDSSSELESDSDMVIDIEIGNMKEVEKIIVAVLKTRLSAYETSRDEDLVLLRRSGNLPTKESTPTKNSEELSESENNVSSKKRKVKHDTKSPPKKQKLDKISYNHYNALIVRVSEKTILHKIIDLYERK